MVNCVGTSHTGSEGIETTDDNSVSTSYNQSENDTSSKGTPTENGLPKFTVDHEQELLFQKRYDERYNLAIDPDYVCWLRFHHPESCLPCESSDLLSESHIPAEDDVSLSVLFYDVTPLEELPIPTPGL